MLSGYFAGIHFYEQIIPINKPPTSKVKNNNECVLFNRINHCKENKTLKHNLTNFALPVCLPLKADVLAIFIEKHRFLVFVNCD
jgi:hypothetical protein